MSKFSALEKRVIAVQHYHEARIEQLVAEGACETVVSLCDFPQPYYAYATEEGWREWMAACEANMERYLHLAADEVTFRPLVFEFWPLVTHFVDALFGARVYPDNTGCNFWNDQLEIPLEALEPIEVEKQPLLQWALEKMQQTLELWPDYVMLGTPVFASVLNIGVNLFGERLLLALATEEAAALRALGYINEALCDLRRLFHSELPADRVRFYAASTRWLPDGYGHLCGCTTQLVGPETYRRLVGDLERDVLNCFPKGGSIHLCGFHTQHIPYWSELPELVGVQLNDDASNDFEAYFIGLRPDQIIHVGLTDKMTLERVLEISKGRRVVIQAPLPEPIPLESLK